MAPSKKSLSLPDSIKAKAPLYKGTYEDIVEANKRFRPLKKPSSGPCKGPFDIPGLLCGNLDTFSGGAVKLVRGAVRVAGIRGRVRGTNPRMDVRARAGEKGVSLRDTGISGRGRRPTKLDARHPLKEVLEKASGGRKGKVRVRFAKSVAKKMLGATESAK